MSRKWERRFGWILVYFPVFAWIMSLGTAFFDVNVVPINRRVSAVITALSFSVGCILVVMFGGLLLSETGTKLNIVRDRTTSTA